MKWVSFLFFSVLAIFYLLFWFFFQVILYAADKIYSDFYQDLKGRVHFTSNDVVSGDASIKIRNVRPADSGTYQCKVKKAPGVAKTTVQLTVIGKS